MPYSLVQESQLDASPAEVWDAVRCMRNVNKELMPWARMTSPGSGYCFSEAETELDVFLFRSVILLFGFIPMDWHFVRMREMKDQAGFQEDSVSITHKYWRHARRIEPTESGCKLIDELTFQPRIPLFGYLALPIYKMIFRGRHKTLRLML